MGSLDAMAEARAQKGHIAEATAVTKSSVVFSLLELPKKNHTLNMLAFVCRISLFAGPKRRLFAKK